MKLLLKQKMPRHFLLEKPVAERSEANPRRAETNEQSEANPSTER